MSEKNSTVTDDASRDRELMLSREKTEIIATVRYMYGMMQQNRKHNDPRVRPSAGRKGIDTSTNYKAGPWKMIKLDKNSQYRILRYYRQLGDHEETDASKLRVGI